MATLVSYLIDDAAQAIGDPNKQRIKTPQWLSIYNQAARQLCQKANVLQFRGIFTLSPVGAYLYPPEMTVMTSLEVTDSPNDDESFRFLDEIFEDQFRGRVSARYPTASLPDSYFAAANWVYLVGRPETSITGGGRITYYGLPDRVTDAVAGVVQTDDFTQDYLIRRMVIGAMEARNRIVEARAALELWEKDVVTLQDKFGDRSQDRRSTLAPRRARYSRMN